MAFGDAGSQAPINPNGMYSMQDASGNWQQMAGAAIPAFNTQQFNTPAPTPFAPPPAVNTPAQNAASFVPPPNTAIIPPSAGAFNPDFTNMTTGKGSGKGPQSMQPTTPAQGQFPGTAAAPMDFHTQLQNFINSGLLGSQQRLSG